MSETTLGQVFVAPAILLMALVALFPVIYAIVISLQAYSGELNEGFARLDNYVEALTDERFWTALQFTVVFTVTSVAAEFLVGLGALLMNQAFRGRGVTRPRSWCPGRSPGDRRSWFFMFNVTPSPMQQRVRSRRLVAAGSVGLGDLRGHLRRRVEDRPVRGTAAARRAADDPR